MRSISTKIIIYAFLIAISIFMIWPFVWMFSTSFKPAEEIFKSPPILISSSMTLDGYRYILRNRVLRIAWNTFFVACSFTALSLFFCTLGGYGFAKYRFPGRAGLFSFLLATMVIPPAVMIVPTYVLMVKINWVNTFWPLIIPGTANAFGIFFMRQYISTVPDEIIDAARMDGASEFGVFWRCILPICSPGLVTLGLIFFMSSWNNFLLPSIYLKSPEKYTLPLMMMQVQGPAGYTLYRELMGIGVVSVVPLLVLFLLFQRRFAEGIAAGAVKA